MHRTCLFAAAVLPAFILGVPGAAAAAKPGEPIVIKEPLVIKAKPPPKQGAGKEQVYYTITLQDAHVADTRAPAGGSAAKVDSFTVKQGVKPYMQYKLDRVMVKSWSTSGDTDAPPTRLQGASRLIVVAPATGGCTVGKRYPAATIVGGGKRYELTDVTISGCDRSAGPEEQITFVYGKINVKY